MSPRPVLRCAAPRPRPAAGPRGRAGRAPARPARPLLAAIGIVLLTILGGCAIPGLSPETSTGSGLDASGTPGTEWFWYQPGDQVASRAAPRWLTSNSAAATDDTQDPVVPPVGNGTASCLARLQADTMNWLSATPGVGQASVSWMGLGDPRVVEYKVAAVLQNRPGGPNPPQAWTTVVPPAGCQELTATVAGLISGSWYVFWLDVVVKTRPGGQREPMIGRSGAFQVA